MNKEALKSSSGTHTRLAPANTGSCAGIFDSIEYMKLTVVIDWRLHLKEHDRVLHIHTSLGSKFHKMYNSVKIGQLNGLVRERCDTKRGPWFVNLILWLYGCTLHRNSLVKYSLRLIHLGPDQMIRVWEGGLCFLWKERRIVRYKLMKPIICSVKLNCFSFAREETERCVSG